MREMHFGFLATMHWNVIANQSKNCPALLRIFLHPKWPIHSNGLGVTLVLLCVWYLGGDLASFGVHVDFLTYKALLVLKH